MVLSSGRAERGNEQRVMGVVRQANFARYLVEMWA